MALCVLRPILALLSTRCRPVRRADVLEEILLRDYGPLAENFHVISNRMRFDETGRLVGFNDPLIHMFNKVRKGEGGGVSIAN